MSGFRVYDKQEKKYPLESEKLFFLMPSGKLYDYGEGKEADPDRYVVEESSGLKDKNGKEYYEGDKVLVSYLQNMVIVVVLEKGKFNISGYAYSQLQIIGNKHDKD